MGHAQKLEASITDNSTCQKANVAESDYMQPYSPSDKYYNDAADLSIYMAHQGADVDMIQDVLQCSKAYKPEKPLPPARTRLSPKKTLQKELQIKELVWPAIDGDLKKA